MSKKQIPVVTETITITRSGNTVAAMMHTQEGESGTMNVQTATCNPKDKFSLYEGARIALARLFGQDPFPYPDGGFKEGDIALDENNGRIVRVRGITDPMRLVRVVELNETPFSFPAPASFFGRYREVPVDKLTKLVKEAKG